MRQASEINWWKNPDGPFAGRFKIMAQHRGGMSEVYICKDIHNGRLVAAKTTPYNSAIFTHEARIWLGLGYHPNIVRAHTVLVTEAASRRNIPFLFMDFIGDANGNSRNYRHILKSSNSNNLAIKLALSVISALQHASSIFPKFVHRDLKPENILADDQENLYVTDFGIGHLRTKLDFSRSGKEAVTSELIQTTVFDNSGKFTGTIGYAAPEQYIDSSKVDVRADIYSLGVMLYETLAGCLPYMPEQILSQGPQILSLPLKCPLNMRNEEFGLWNIIKKMLSYRPEARYSSLASLKKDINGLGHNERDVPNSSTSSKEVLYNRVCSYLMLNDSRSAISVFINNRDMYPLTFEAKKVARDIYSNHASSGFISKIIRNELIAPRSVFKHISILLSIYLAVIFGVNSFNAIQLALAGVLMVLLYSENFYNSITLITPDKITLPFALGGLVVGLLFGENSLSGGLLYSFLGLAGGLGIPLLIGSGIEKIWHKEYLGGGTVKLLAMVGSWIGLKIFAVLLVFIILLLLQAKINNLIKPRTSGRVKWKGAILTPTYVYTTTILPSSLAITLATIGVLAFGGSLMK